MKDIGAGYIQEGQGRSGGQYVLLVAVKLPDNSYIYLTDSMEESITALDQADSTTVSYVRAPLKVDMLETNITNEIPVVRLSVDADPNGVVATYVKDNDGLRGCDVYLIRTFRAFIGTADEATCREKTMLTVDSSSVSDTQVTFNLTSPLVVYSLTVPRRRFYRDFCSRKYKEGPLSATDFADYYCDKPDGTSTGCKRTLDDCRDRSYQRHFGGFPTIPRTRIRIR
jgi:phage-related protein